jgi:hypothetical protein
VRPDHLFLGRQIDNVRDCWRKGRGVALASARRGEENNRSVLNNEQVREIRRRHAAGEASRKLGKEFGVSKTLVLLISSRRIWNHIGDQP